MAAALLLGFASGLPLYLTGMVLVTWMADEGVTLATASAFASVGLPYTFKWAWAPLFD
ncbi:MAG: AmpG family muropeptide MFS transporter, partial [Kofleriaceae bacterium]